MTEIYATDQIGLPILSLMIILPLLVAAGLYLVSAPATQRMIAYGGVVAELVLGLVAVMAFQSGVAGMQLVENAAWIPSLGASFHLGVDGISVLFLPLSALVILMVMLGADSKGNDRWFWANLMVLLTAAIGVYAALDLVLFFLFWELMLIPSYFLIRMWGVGSERQAAAMKYVLYMLIGSVPLLIGVAALGATYGTFNLVELQGISIPWEMQTTVFALLFLGFAVKAPLPPFHTWLPSVAMEGQSGMAIFLVGLKLGTFGMIKVLLPLAPDVAVAWQPVLMWIGVLAMLYGGLVALAQTNLRRLLAYASVSHVGMVVVGIFSLTEAGLQGAVMAMINMGLASTAMMLIAGSLYQRLGTTELTGLGGIARYAPVLAVAFFVAGLASIGMPGTSGFQGEFALLSGVFEADRLIGAVALLGVILGAGYVLWYYERAFFGPAGSKDITSLRDLGKSERWGAGVAIALILLIGLAPMVAINTVSGSSDALVAMIGSGAEIQTAQVVLGIN
ncbi:MAG: NADH-quinone oxidoreductase subunit M [Pseudomonadota bacterium]